MSTHMHYAKELRNFIANSPSPFHVVDTARKMLAGHGFTELREQDEWRVRPNDRFIITKNHSMLIAVAVGGAYQPGNALTMLGAHTDSPCLKVKPRAEFRRQQLVQVGVETYGGGIWYTWFDRDLTLAGRCIVRTHQPDSAPSDYKYAHRLVNFERPIARLSSLAIHLDRGINESFGPNKESHLAPTLCSSVSNSMKNCSSSANSSVAAAQSTSSSSISDNQQLSQKLVFPDGVNNFSYIKEAVARHLQLNQLRNSSGNSGGNGGSDGVSDANVDAIVNLELNFVDAAPPAIGGLNDDFLFAPRLDNQFGCYAGLQGFLEALPSLQLDTNIRVVCLFDNEECGSNSVQGAETAFTEMTLRRIVRSFAATTSSGGSSAGCSSADSKDLDFERGIAQSFLLSADQSHATHPNYEEQHEKCHHVALRGGPVLKINSNQRYATSGLTGAVVKEIAELARVDLQEFVVRQDKPCGSTIGPILSARLGVATADIGSPQLSMHSCREMCHVESVRPAVLLNRAFFQHYPEIYRAMHANSSN